MASNMLCTLCGLVMVIGSNLFAVNGQNPCSIKEFWSADIDGCVPCSSCKQYPKTPSCNTCIFLEDSPDGWKLAAITSFSVLAVVLISAGLIIGVMVHRRRSKKRPLREPIEETTGP